MAVRDCDENQEAPECPPAISLAEQAILGAVEALGLLGDEADAERDLARVLRETGNKPTQREIVLRVLRCCARLPAAEPFVQIEAEAKSYAERVKATAEQNARKQAHRLIEAAEFSCRNKQYWLTQEQQKLAVAQEDCERRHQEMTGPHAPAIALLQSILGQYPLPPGERLPPTAFLSACALVASLMGTNPVDLALNLSGGNFEFSKRK